MWSPLETFIFGAQTRNKIVESCGIAAPVPAKEFIHSKQSWARSGSKMLDTMFLEVFAF